MKKTYIFGDTETTGTGDKGEEQILDYAKIVTQGSEVVDSFNKEIIVKKNVIPHPKALLVNNINPFSKEWQEKAIHEHQAVDVIINQVQKFKGTDYIYIAYNAPFDVGMLSQMFTRNGKDFNKLFPVVFDLFLLAKHLIDKGLIKTKTNEYGGQSAKLSDVYQGLGFSASDMNAHNALGDTVILPAIADKMYLLFSGKEMSEIDINPQELKDDDIVSIMFLSKLVMGRSRPLQLERKTILIIKNDQINHKLYYVDADTVKKDPLASVSKSVQIMEYSQVFDEITIETTPTRVLQKYLKDQADEITQYKTKILTTKIEYSLDMEGFDNIKSLTEKLNSAEVTLEIIQSLSDEEKNILKNAEELSYAMHNKGWSLEIYGEDYQDRIKYIWAKNNLRVGLDPKDGNYIIEDINQDLSPEVLRSGTKTPILTYLTENKIIESKDEDFKKLSSTFIPSKEFKNDKYLDKILVDFNINKVEVFGGANKSHKEILTDLLKFYQAQYPLKFKDVKLPSYKLDLSSFKKKT